MKRKIDNSDKPGNIPKRIRIRAAEPRHRRVTMEDLLSKNAQLVSKIHELQIEKLQMEKRLIEAEASKKLADMSLLMWKMKKERCLMPCHGRSYGVAADANFYGTPWLNRVRKPHKFRWLRKPRTLKQLPEAVIRHIASFLKDDVLFKLRVTNLLFYGAYYNQEVHRLADNEMPWDLSREFDAVRAMKLALRGRRFPKVTFILTTIYYHATWQDLSVLSPRHFPNLNSIYIAQLEWKTSLVSLPRHPKICAFYCPYFSTHEAKYINPGRYPSLRLCDLQAVKSTAWLPAHKNLEELILIACSDVKWEIITRENFPSLLVVKKIRRDPIPDDIKSNLEKNGIRVEWVPFDAEAQHVG